MSLPPPKFGSEIVGWLGLVVPLLLSVALAWITGEPRVLWVSAAYVALIVIICINQIWIKR
jgi:hypothetical protein